MSSQDVRPKWRQLYLTGPLLIILFAIDHRLNISARGHQSVQAGIVLFVYGLIYLWHKANSAALSKMDREQYRGKITMFQTPPYQLPDVDEEQHLLIQLPESEIKGVWSDTFEMDCTDVKFLPRDEISQESKNE